MIEIIILMSAVIIILIAFLIVTKISHNQLLSRHETPKVGTNKKQRNNKDRKHDYLSGRKKPGVYNDINYK